MKRTSMRKDLFALFALFVAFAPREALAKEKNKPAEKEKEAAAAESAEEDELAESGLSIGARSGYALPVGTVARDPFLNGVTDLSRYASGMVPFAADVGYRITPHWYVGGTFTFGIVSTGSQLCQGVNGGCTSSANDIRAGGMLKYTFAPERKLTPWIGVGGGYEVLNISRTVGTVTTDATVKGWELLNVHAGLDYRAATHVTVGPVVGFSLAQYTSFSQSSSNGQSTSTDINNTALHHWFFFGVGGKYDL
jgi:hypothetical protein